MSEKRWVELEGVDNVRDLGGLPVSGGRRTKRGVVFRSSTLQELTYDDLDLVLGAHRVRTILDLRLPDEAAREGHGLLAGSGVTVLNLPVRKASSTLRDVVVPDARSTDLAELYTGLLRGSAHSVVMAARVIAQPDQQSVVFHCAAGKDRTGVLAAVLLDAVGVATDAVVDDYVMSAERQHEVRERLVRLPAYQNLPPVAHGVMGVEGTAMQRFMAALHGEYGGGARFLVEHGLTEQEFDALRVALIEAA